MDGQRPMEELSEAPNLRRVLGFLDGNEKDRQFVVEEPSMTTTVVRLMNRSDVRLISSTFHFLRSLLTPSSLIVLGNFKLRASGKNHSQRCLHIPSGPRIIQHANPAA